MIVSDSMTPKEVAELITTLANFGLERMHGDAPNVAVSSDEDIVTFEVGNDEGVAKEFQLRVQEM